MNKPEHISQWAWDIADENVLCSDAVFPNVSLTFEEHHILQTSIATALMEARAEEKVRGEDWENAAHDLIWKRGNHDLFDELKSKAHQEAHERLAAQAIRERKDT